jgi:hypothetical protein
MALTLRIHDETTVTDQQEAVIGGIDDAHGEMLFAAAEPIVERVEVNGDQSLGYDLRDTRGFGDAILKALTPGDTDGCGCQRSQITLHSLVFPSSTRPASMQKLTRFLARRNRGVGERLERRFVRA